ncbi:MAG: glycosyltransferase family 2 protein [Betaproteobacteria bacterium]
MSGNLVWTAGTTAHLTAGGSQQKHFLSLLAPVKDEESYLLEFINYYLIQGVDHFYFYDNDSKIPVVDVIREYRDCCTVLKASGDAVQVRAYAHFCRHFKQETNWLAIFDIDEFVLPHKHGSLREFLADYDHCDGIGINWVMFGDGHHDTRPDGGVIANYLYRAAKQHPCIKSVVKTRKLVEIGHPHLATLREGSLYVDPHGNRIASAYNENHTIDVIQLNHYFTKSKAEWNTKLHRKRADTGKSRAEHTEDHAWVFTVNEACNEIRETLIVDRYGSRLAEAMTARGAPPDAIPRALPAG